MSKPVKKKPPKKRKPESLTDKEEQLCREFVADFAGNQTRAYLHVYPNHTYESARVMASKTFAKPNIKSRIAELQKERNKRLEISGDRVLSEIAKLAFYDPRDFFNSDMQLKSIDELDPDHAAIIAGIETQHKTIGTEKSSTVLTKIKLADKGANLERLGKYFKLFTDKHEIGIDPETAELILAALPPEYAKAVKEKLMAMKGK
jgi:phage terminase small subunit